MKKKGEKDGEKVDKRRRAGGGDAAPLRGVLLQSVALLRHLPHDLPLNLTVAPRGAARLNGATVWLKPPSRDLVDARAREREVRKSGRCFLTK